MTLLEQAFKYINKKKQEQGRITAKTPDQDFIPYVCHYDKNSILTKNGEILQIIRVTGLNDNNSALDLVSLRESVRDAIYENSESEKFAFWFHTIRRRKSVVAKGESDYKDYFSNEVDRIWTKENELESQFVNEFYITILHEGLNTPVSDFKSFAKSFSYKTIQKEHKEFLEYAQKNLDEVTQKILLQVEDFGAKILGIKDWKGVLYSEPMRFFGKIINLYEDRYPVSTNDISDDLSSHKIAFGSREIEVMGEENKNFAAMMTIKECHEVSTESLDKILNMPFEFIISQSFDFEYDKKELEPFKERYNLLKVSEDKDFQLISGFKDFIESDSGKKNDYGKLQTNIMVISNNIENLKKDLDDAVEKFSELGFATVREDIFSEHCFWSQLPGNFAFLRRRKLNNTAKVPSFAALNSFPSGSFHNNHWGPAVTTLKTIINTPYFFNFHEKDHGHTMIVGPKSSGKTILTNFLLTQAQKFNNRIFYFDCNNSSKLFINALGGKYHKITKNIEDDEFLSMNPFSLPANEDNAAFLTYWIKQLVMFLKLEVKEEELNATFEIINNVLNSKEPNFLIAFDALRSEKTRRIYEKLKIWGNGKLSYIFGSQTEIDWSEKTLGFNFDEILNQKPILIPVISYLLHKIESVLDGSPAIIVFDEALEFLDNKIFHSLISEILHNLKEKNCIVIFNLKDHNLSESSLELVQEIYKNCATEIYMPNHEPPEYFNKTYELQEGESEVLKFMAQDSKRHILIKHGQDSLIADNDLSTYNEILSIFSANELANMSYEEIISELKQENQEPNPETWIPQFVEVLKALIEQQKEEQKQKIMEQEMPEVEAAKKELEQKEQEENLRASTEEETDEDEDEDEDEDLNLEFEIEDDDYEEDPF